MRTISAAELAEIFTFPTLIEALRDGFRREVVTPLRHRHMIKIGGEPDAALLLMPAWDDLSNSARSEDGYVGVKIVSVYPGNAKRDLPGVAAVYMLMSGRTGEPLAVIDGELTNWRTAAASALAASYLAREDASSLLMVGAGALAPFLIEAHASVRPIEEVTIWNRSKERAEALAELLADRPYAVSVASDLETAVWGADIVSCATLSSAPLVRGAWLRRGAHVDLVGAFTPTMRESDDDAVRRARLFVDTWAGALKEAGDILQPIEAGAISEKDVVGDLFDLCRGKVEGRRSSDEITMFKSVGTALEDLVAAALAMAGGERRGARKGGAQR
jgi:ornithine cyclodeaminase